MSLLYKIPEPIRFAISGGIGNILFFYTDQLMNTLFSFITPISFRLSFCWFLSYTLSILYQHLLHQFLVFGKAENYLKSLLVVYGSYSISLAISPFLNGLLYEYIFHDEFISWISTLLLTGILNYYTVGNSMKKKEVKAK